MKKSNKSTKFKLNLIMSMAFSFSFSTLFALEEDRDKPLQFEANNMFWDQKIQKMRYTGNVEIRQGEFLLKADVVYINRDKGKKANITNFIATGTKQQAYFRDLPKLDEDEIKAWADEIIYDTGLRKLTLTGNAKILRGKDDIKAPVLFYYLESRNIEARGKVNSSDAKNPKATDKADEKDRIQITISPETLNSETKKEKEDKQGN